MDTPRVLDGRYELADPLGAGGMGRVFRGTDRVLGRTVAVKILAPHLAQDPKAVSRFRREARSAAGLTHPSIVSVYDSGSEDGWHYLVMEHVEGRTLGQILREEGPLLPRRAAEIAAELARALSEAHAAGIVHRDVKPGNMMVGPDGHTKVVDFGIAAAVSSDSVTETAAVLGTVSYLAPEQVRGGRADPRSDLYALGVVLYEMLTGRPPFMADSPLAVAYKHLEEGPLPPSQVNPDVPSALEAVVLRALAKDPDDRYPSAEAVLADLERYLDDPEFDPTTVAPLAGSWADEDDTPTAVVATGPGAHRAPRSRRGMVALLVAAALAAGVPAALILSSGDEARTTPPGSERTPGQGGSPGQSPDEAASPEGESSTKQDGEKEEAPSKDEEGDSSSEGEEEDEGSEPSPTPTSSPTASPTPSTDPSPSPSPSASP